MVLSHTENIKRAKSIGPCQPAWVVQADMGPYFLDMHLVLFQQCTVLIFCFSCILLSAWEGFSNPPNWNNRNVWNLSSDPSNNGYQNEDLIVWMRTAALPTFRKLYRRVNHNSEAIFKDGLPKGTYEVNITYGNEPMSLHLCRFLMYSRAPIIQAPLDLKSRNIEKYQGTDFPCTLFTI